MDVFEMVMEFSTTILAIATIVVYVIATELYTNEVVVFKRCLFKIMVHTYDEELRKEVIFVLIQTLFSRNN
ncbi:hypothetical protein QE152_g45 [Popillia japonica]|uniref:Uncharacterized protein n=1 Tax=Popillia japonica TaxID=7064 RepID=A0AAW1NHU5_POPJA